DAEVSRQRPASVGDRARRSGAGIDVWMGALRRECRPRHRHEDVWCVRAADGAAAEVRIRARPRRHGCEGAAGQALSDGLQTASSSPLGATPAFARASAGRPAAGGVNFSVFSKHATGVELLLFDRVDDAGPSRIVRLDPADNRTYHYWHVFVPDVRPGQLYGYRVDGPFNPSNGLRFDPTKVLLDPYGRGIAVPG